MLGCISQSRDLDLNQNQESDTTHRATQRPRTTMTLKNMPPPFFWVPLTLAGKSEKSLTSVEPIWQEKTSS